MTQTTQSSDTSSTHSTDGIPHITIDFETRSVYTIKAGQSRYAKDESTEVLCLAYCLPNGSVRVWNPSLPPPQDLFDEIAKGTPVHAHNAPFEMAIWDNIMVVKFGWPKVPLDQWRCNAAMCAANGLPRSLENAGKALRLTITKDVEGHKLMMKMCKPRKPSKHDPSVWHEKPDQLQRLYAYCGQDVLSEQAIFDNIHPLSAREQAVWQFDQKMNARGVPIDIELAQSAVKIWKKHSETLNKELAELTEGDVTTSQKVKALIGWFARNEFDISSLDKQSVDTALRHHDLDPKVRRALQIRRELSLSSISKYTKMLECVESDGRIRGCSLYYGAATGRYAGRLVQLQNIARGCLKDDEVDPMIKLVKEGDLETLNFLRNPGDVLSSLIRPTLAAEKGHKFINVDFSQIEARCLAWAAGQHDLVKAFRDNQDVYVKMAGSIYMLPESEIDDNQRQMGKACTLGAGYQMGPSKFKLTLFKKGIDISDEESERVIKAYRAANPRIKSFWYDMERAAIKTVETHKKHRVGPVVFHRDGRNLYMRLPSGRDIFYFEPKIEEGKYGPKLTYTGTDNGRPVRVSSYGGHLTENAIQAICRDILVEAMSRLEQARYEVCFHVHDEITVHAPISFGSADEMAQIMKVVPKWAEGMPIDAKGFESDRYKK